MAEFDLADALGGLSKTALGELLPEGVYPMRVESSEYTVSKNKGTSGWIYRAVITDGEFAGEQVEGTAWWSAKPRGTQLYWQQMTALGVTLEWVQATRPSPEQIAESLLGAHFMGDVGIEEPPAGSRMRKRNRLIALSAIVDESAAADADGYGQAEDDGSGEVLQDDLFTEPAAEDQAASPAAVDVEPQGPTGDLDDPSLPSPDGTAGDQAVALDAPAADAVADPNSTEDDPWS